MTTTNNISSIWVNNRRKRSLLDFLMFWKKRPCPEVKLPTPLHLIESCKGLVLNNLKVKSILFSTDIALIENNDADAILAVYPFAPSQNIIKTLIEFSKKPVICGIGGGITQGDFAITMAKKAEALGAAAVIVNQPFKNEDIAEVKKHINIPIISSVSTLNFDFKSRIEAGVSCFNVTGGADTLKIVDYIKTTYPDIAIISTGGKTNKSLQNIAQKKVNAIILTPPSNGELFRSIMDGYREQ
ncbi:hypothetical protein HX045_11575 [Myroides odoratimimus]|uniref:hypothetical protein n=2 Tax=Myroides odoratimimus TaxID=76832 RepID=UPI000246073D|nr:hypothetical protein [Myroides odoratimimus]EHO11381.1 hypothetical protein HMPREF9714_01399 [Myroides odoratimimus CCUG 12901]MCA4807347.1 hypothetical protein [Myroides odoratimimus]MDM1398077.1 hypothetical protein [Myroides odoratimimus]MDM1402343.1 hypothetical protein [Myroides odoratimimus]MDM1412241.1 hypothetical protein [Myroides odoratimimus]